MFLKLRLWTILSFRSLFDLRLNTTDNLRALLRTGPTGENSRSEPDPLAGEIFFFSKAKLQELKKMVSKLASDETSWISTNDALASLIWCCVTAAHNTDIRENVESIKGETGSVKTQANEGSSAFGFVIDARRLIRPPLPGRFIGNVLIWAYIIEPLSTVVPTAEGVTECAHSLRRKIKQHGDNYIPSFIGALKSLPDVGRLTLGRMGFDERSVVVNSWAAQDFYDLDWGRLVGGRCERVRIHKPKLENFCLVLPELKDCEGNEEAFKKPESGILSPDSFSMARFYPVDDHFVYKSSDLESQYFQQSSRTQ